MAHVISALARQRQDRPISTAACVAALGGASKRNGLAGVRMAEFDDVSVLVIEDEQHARRLIVQMLRQIGVGAIYEAT